MIATAGPEDYRRTIETLIDADAADAILTIFVPPLVSEAIEVARAIRDVAGRQHQVPIAAVFMTGEAPPAELADGAVRVPGFEFPEDAARAIARAARHGRWRARPEQVVTPVADARQDEAAAVISAALARGDGWLSPPEVEELLRCYGLPLVDSRFARTPEEAAQAAAELGGPVALKASASGLLHKTDAGGVRLGLEGSREVHAWALEIESTVRAAGYELEGLLVQPMTEEGVELIVGVASDPSFGPVLACGAGGTLAELTSDVNVRITPIGPLDAQEMIRGLRSFPLLEGYRGTPPCDVGAIEDVLLRVSAMVEAHREIVELDCNPLIAQPEGAVIVDARVRVESVPPTPPMPSLRGQGTENH
jgi:acyl-CoA synthetase (NDP forming)